MRKSTAAPLGLVLLALSIGLSAIAQLALKVGMQALREAVESGALPLTSVSLSLLESTIAWTGSGLLAYALSMLAWLAVLVRYPLSFAYPLLSISYVIVYFWATHWDRLTEVATPLRTTGTVAIAIGVALVSLTHSRASDNNRAT